jgi:hypothetical protein
MVNLSSDTSQIIRTSFERSYIPTNLHPFQATCKRCTETKECSFAFGLLQTYNLAKQIVMTDKSLFCLCFCLAVKLLTRSEGINQL